MPFYARFCKLENTDSKLFVKKSRETAENLLLISSSISSSHLAFIDILSIWSSANLRNHMKQDRKFAETNLLVLDAQSTKQENGFQSSL